MNFSIDNSSFYTHIGYFSPAIPFKAVLLLNTQQENMTRQHPTLPGGGRFRADLSVFLLSKKSLDSECSKLTFKPKLS